MLFGCTCHVMPKATQYIASALALSLRAIDAAFGASVHPVCARGLSQYASLRSHGHGTRCLLMHRAGCRMPLNGRSPRRRVSPVSRLRQIQCIEAAIAKRLLGGRDGGLRAVEQCFPAMWRASAICAIADVQFVDSRGPRASADGRQGPFGQRACNVCRRRRPEETAAAGGLPDFVSRQRKPNPGAIEQDRVAREGGAESVPLLRPEAHPVYHVPQNVR